MTHTTPSLCALLAQHLEREAGALAPKLAANDPAALRDLHKRMLKNINDNSTLSQAQQRRLLLAFALLEDQGPNLDPALDHVLTRALPGLSDALFRALGDALYASIQALPDARREHLLRALVHAALLNLTSLSALGDGARPWLPALAKAEILSLLQQKQPLKLYGVPRTPAQLLAALRQLHSDLVAPPWVEALLAPALQQLSGPTDQYIYVDPALISALQLLPEDRLTALMAPYHHLLSNAPALCTTPALARLALDNIAPGSPGWVRTNLLHAFSQNPQTQAAVIEDLLHNKRDRLGTWTTLHPHLTQPDALLTVLSIDDPNIALHCAAKLVALGHELAAEPTLHHLLHTPHARARALCARVLRALSLTADIKPLAQVALARSPDLHDTLKDIDLDPQQRLAAAWAQHQQHLLDDTPEIKKAITFKSLRPDRGVWHLFNAQQLALTELFRDRFDDPATLFLALEAVPGNKDFARMYLQTIEPLFGAALTLATSSWLDQGRGHEDHWELFAWLNQRAEPTDKAIQRAFLHGDKVAAEGALQRLTARGEAALPLLTDLLTGGEPKQRALAARALGAIGRKDAAAPLRAALAKERSKPTREAIDQALQRCDPMLRRIQQASRDLGVYDYEQPLRLNDALEQLRALLYEEPTLLSWVRLCDLLERLDAIGSLSLGVDYITADALARWPAEQRPAPTTWDKHPLLRALPGPAPETPWLPISRLTREDTWRDQLKPALDDMERGARTRRFSQELVSIFLQETRRAWRWCEERGAPLEKLELRVDGGAIAKNFVTMSQTTAMELWQGFGVTLQRRPIRKDGEGGPAGLRYARVAIPAKHPLRDQLGMVGHTRYFELPSGDAES